MRLAVSLLTGAVPRLDFSVVQKLQKMLNQASSPARPDTHRDSVTPFEDSMCAWQDSNPQYNVRSVA